MVEKSSYWVLQEVFVDAGIAGRKLDCDLNLKVVTDVKREKENCIVTVEIFGSLTSGNEQVANVRFVNISKLLLKRKVTAKMISRKITKQKVDELVAFIPIYFIKAGISVREVNYEL